jgi:hypothetical protein
LFVLRRIIGVVTTPINHQTNVSATDELRRLPPWSEAEPCLRVGEDILGTVLEAFFFTAVRSQMIALGAPPPEIAFVGLLLVCDHNTSCED